MQDLQAIIDFFDRICLEDTLYFVIPDAYGRQSYEIQWDRRQKAEQSWQARILGHNNWHHFSSTKFVEFAQTDSLDLNLLAKELAGSLLTQAVFARTLIRGVEDLLGKERVEEAEQQTLLFIEQLKQMATSSLAPNSNVAADLAPAPMASKKSAIRGLRLVSPSDSQG